MSETQTYLGLLWEVTAGPLDGAVGRCVSVNRKKGIVELKIDRQQLWPSMRYQYRSAFSDIFGETGYCLATVPMEHVQSARR